jgi:hypothetical protein
VTLLHPPYTLWHLSYGDRRRARAAHEVGSARLDDACVLPRDGIGAHALDELQGRPLQTLIARASSSRSPSFPSPVRARSGSSSRSTRRCGCSPSSPSAALVVVAYNLELLGGAIHTSFMFAFAWGAFPVLTAYFASAHTLRGEAIAAAAFAFLTSYAQRVLSTPVRFARRNIGDPELARTAEIGLKLIAAAMPLLAAALLLARVP